MLLAVSGPMRATLIIQVARMTGLETLKISYCPMGNPGLRLITASCPKLSRVTLEGCWISTWCLLCIVLRHPHLKYWKDGDHSNTISAYTLNLLPLVFLVSLSFTRLHISK